MASYTSQLIVSLLDRVSGPARQVAQSLNGMNRRIAESGQRASFGERISANLMRTNEAIDRARGNLIDAVAGFYVLKQALTGPTQAAQDLEIKLAGLGAKANLTAEQLSKIAKAAEDTGRATNQFTADIIEAQDHLVGMGLEVGRSTKAMPAIGRAATATGASILDLSKAGFAAMSNLGVAAEDLAKSFDIMAAAGKAGGFELKDMAQYLPAITGLAESKGMTGQRGLAEIAAALQVVRRGAGDASEAATNFMNILQKINSNDAIKNFEEKGIDIQKVLKDAAANGADPLEASLRAINKALDGDMSRLGELFADAQVQKGLLPLLNNLDDYIKLRDDAGKASGVNDADFARMMETSQERLKQFQISMQNLQTSVGAALIPVLTGIAGALKPVVEGLTAIVNAQPRLVGALVAITAGFIGLKAALAGLQFLGLMGRGGALIALSVGLRAVTAALAGLKAAAVTAPLAVAAAGLTRLRASLAGLSMLATVGGPGAMFKAMGAGILGLLNPMNIVRGAAVALRGALLFSGVGAILLGIAAAGKFIYDNWTGIKEAFTAFGRAFSAALGPVKPMLDPVIDGAGRLFGWVSKLSLEISPARWQAWGEAAGAAVGNVVRFFAELPGKIAAAVGSLYDIGAQLMQSFWDGLVSVANGMLDYVSGIGTRIKNALTFTGPTLTPGVNPRGAGAGIKARAGGGPISRGSTYWTGEKGPELITAGRSGYVNKAGSQAAAPNISIGPFHFNNTKAADAAEIASQVRKALHDEVRETFRGIYSDVGMRIA